VADTPSFDESDELHALSEEARRAAAAVRHERSLLREAAAQSEEARARSQELRAGHVDVWDDLHRIVTSLARAERAAGRPPDVMTAALKAVIRSAGLDDELRTLVEAQLVELAIQVYRAA
jgi:hypothetical protein